jgi:hypothetical protein
MSLTNNLGRSPLPLRTGLALGTAFISADHTDSEDGVYYTFDCGAPGVVAGTTYELFPSRDLTSSRCNPAVGYYSASPTHYSDPFVWNRDDRFSFDHPVNSVGDFIGAAPQVYAQVTVRNTAGNYTVNTAPIVLTLNPVDNPRLAEGRTIDLTTGTPSVTVPPPLPATTGTDRNGGASLSFTVTPTAAQIAAGCLVMVELRRNIVPVATTPASYNQGL